uniref:Uncharacterized protein n=1 Tax=Acrobeloides nanus TaxID=290746 RepID=A0A914EIE8_9BILA
MWIVGQTFLLTNLIYVMGIAIAISVSPMNDVVFALTK